MIDLTDSGEVHQAQK